MDNLLLRGLIRSHSGRSSLSLGQTFWPLFLPRPLGERAECYAAFAVIGDSTNTTRRLQSLTCDLQVDIVSSQALLDAVCRETPDADQVLRGFRLVVRRFLARLS